MGREQKLCRNLGEYLQAPDRHRVFAPVGSFRLPRRSRLHVQAHSRLSAVPLARVRLFVAERGGATAGLLWAEAQMRLPPAGEEVQRVLAADALGRVTRKSAPRLTRIVLPFPIGTEGIVDWVGGTKRCL